MPILREMPVRSKGILGDLYYHEERLMLNLHPKPGSGPCFLHRKVTARPAMKDVQCVYTNVTARSFGGTFSHRYC